jgi:hypothetical protein
MKATFNFPMYALITLNDGEFRLRSLHVTDESALSEIGNIYLINKASNVVSTNNYHIIPVDAGTGVDELERVIETAARQRVTGVGK